jgi:signal transduction histidine kinase
MSNLRTSIVRALALYKDEPKKRRTGSQLNNMQFSIDWERLDRSDVDNLCFELLTQMGFSKIAWETRASEIDITAETSKKDPDGYEYRELWLIGLGRKTSLFKLLDMARKDPEYLLHRLMRSDLRSIHFSDRIESMSSVTLLIITDEDYPIDDFERMRQLSLPMSSIETINLRIRVWDRAYLASLIRQFPMIGYKYFSEEGRAQSKYRKTPEELYRENLELNRNLVNTLAAYEEEKNRRIRAERDAIWKDISYSAAHKIGNPIFAIETNLDPLQRRIDRNNAGEATEIVNDIRFSVEKAKGIVDQFKSLARSQEIKIISTLIKPLIIDACGVAKNNGIVCMIDCEDNIRVLGDPDKLGECFDELVANSLSWFDKPEKSLTFSVKVATEDMLPTTIDTSKRYAIIYVQDNGTGVPTDKKDDIFNAFVTTRDHGTGLGLALVRRIIEGHAGIIRETGMPGQGALFEIYIPLAEG